MRIKNDKQQKPNSSWRVIVRDSFAGWTCVLHSKAAELHRLEEAASVAVKVGAIHITVSWTWSMLRLERSILSCQRLCGSLIMYQAHVSEVWSCVSARCIAASFYSVYPPFWEISQASSDLKPIFVLMWSVNLLQHTSWALLGSTVTRSVF